MAGYYNDNWEWVSEEPDAAPPPAEAPHAYGEFPEGWYGPWGFIPRNSGQAAGQQDLSYWASRGIFPDQIFDENGQTRPGWERTARGYDRTNTTTTPPTVNNPLPPPTGGGGGGGYPTGSGYQPPARMQLSALNYPDFNAPRFSAPAPFSYDPFAYENFAAPTLEEAQNEPGFDYALKQGIKAYENSKAYTGTYRGGGTVKGINDYARNMANQNYGQVFERKAQTYDRNRGNAFGNWSANRNNAAENYMTNYGISRDVFDRDYTAAKDEYAPRARAAELQFGRDWDLFAYEGDDAYRRWKTLVEANSA